MGGLDYSYSGLKTSFLYFIRDNLKSDEDFIEKNKPDLAASIQKAIVQILMKKLVLAAEMFAVKDIAVAGGVSANTYFRKSLTEAAKEYGWKTFIPELQFCTDNAAMIAITGFFKYLNNEFTTLDVSPYSKQTS